MRQYVVLLVILALSLAGCATAGARFDSALNRWRTRPVAHYLLRTEEQVRGRHCDQAAEIRDRVRDRVISDTCARSWAWTVDALFSYVARAQISASGCARLVVGLGCVCQHAVETRVEYDPALGYPREIQTRQTWRANWQEQGYWHYAVHSRSLPDCTPPVSAFFRRVVVTELRPLP